MFIILAVSLGARRGKNSRWSRTPRGAADDSVQQRQYPICPPETSNLRLKGACQEGMRALDRAWRGVAIAAAAAVAAIVGSQLVGFRCTSVGFLA